MGWRLAGLTLDHGKTPNMPEVSADGRQKAMAIAAGVAERYGVPTVEPETVSTWLGDNGRTTYLLDVRSAEEFEAGHMRGSRHAAGGQLVQALDQWCAVRGARIVLLDDDAGVRATMTAHWLVQMGWDVHVLAGGVRAHASETGGLPISMANDAMLDAVKTVSVEELKAGDGAIADVDVSGDFREGHIPGAVWGVRPRLEKLLAASPGDGPITLYSEHETRARLAAVDLAGMTDRPVRVLAGGREAWRAAGLPLEASPDAPSDADRIDFLFWVHDRHLGNDQAARDYLAWEEQLPEQIEREGGGGFSIR